MRGLPATPATATDDGDCAHPAPVETLVCGYKTQTRPEYLFPLTYIYFCLSLTPPTTFPDPVPDLALVSTSVKTRPQPTTDDDEDDKCLHHQYLLVHPLPSQASLEVHQVLRRSHHSPQVFVQILTATERVLHVLAILS